MKKIMIKGLMSALIFVLSAQNVTAMASVPMPRFETAAQAAASQLSLLTKAIEALGLDVNVVFNAIPPNATIAQQIAALSGVLRDAGVNILDVLKGNIPTQPISPTLSQRLGGLVEYGAKQTGEFIAPAVKPLMNFAAALKLDNPNVQATIV